MLRTMCKGKIHRATVTETNVNYVGSITIDKNLLEAADMLPYEKVQVVDVTNGARLETYIIEGEANSGVICLNGAAAHLINTADTVIIMSFGIYTAEELKTFRPQIVLVDEWNRQTEIIHHPEVHGTTEMRYYQR